MGSVARTIECPKCGAPLSPLAGQATCTFCGTTCVVPAGGPVEDESFKRASLVSPIWFHAWRGVHKWLWPRDDETAITVMPFADPFAAAHRAQVQHVAVADRLALETRAHVASLVGYRADGTGVLKNFTGPMSAYKDMEAWVTDYQPSPVAVLWAELGADDSSPTVLRARAPACGTPAVEMETSAPPALVASTFLDWALSKAHVPRVTRVEAPSWYASPPPELTKAYNSHLDSILVTVLATNSLVTAKALNLAENIEVAFNFAALPAAPPQSRLFPLAQAILVAEMGMLDVGHRRRALEAVRAATSRGDLLTWLSPRVLRALGETNEAEAREKTLRSGSGPYDAWLDAIAQPK